MVDRVIKIRGNSKELNIREYKNGVISIRRDPLGHILVSPLERDEFLQTMEEIKKGDDLDG